MKRSYGELVLGHYRAEIVMQLLELYWPQPEPSTRCETHSEEEEIMRKMLKCLVSSTTAFKQLKALAE